MLNGIREILSKLDNVGIWSIKLLKLHSSAREGFSCAAREIKFESEEALRHHVEDIKVKYLGNKPLIEKYQDVREYDGTTEEDIIYELDAKNDLIKESYEIVMSSLVDADHEGDPLKDKYSAYALSGVINNKPIYLFSMQSPFVNMQKKYLLDKTTFKKIDKPVLSLRLNIDVLIYDDKVYFFSMSGEKLFNMERAYKIVCDYRISDVVESGILVENEEFKKIASAGTNPRRLVSFNTEYLERLKNKKTREKIAKKFDIPIREGKFDTEQDGAADKLIRVLCKKGMVDPFDSEPMEVSGTRSWS